tara:strand:- start:139 stop:528 length:390 start_codon:yes stop_codon:yes gene_type:complete
MNAQLIRLDYIRTRLFMTRRAYANSLGLSASAYSNMFKRNSRVSEVLANSFQLMYNFPAEWLLVGEREEVVKDPLDEKLHNIASQVVEQLDADSKDNEQKNDLVERAECISNLMRCVNYLRRLDEKKND